MPFSHKNRLRTFWWRTGVPARPVGRQRPSTIASSRQGERGYILLTLMLFVALMIIAAAVILPTVTFQAKRDREQELIHRGVQYSRAIRRYVKKTGRYPTRLEDLESTNNVRYLRKRYKDPLNGKDFKLLHLGEVKMVGTVGIAGATPAGVTPGGAAGLLQQAQALGAGGLAAAGLAAAGGLNAGLNTGGLNAGQTPGQPDKADPDAPGTDKDSGDTEADDKAQPGFNGPTFGGGPIVGVASTSKDKTIRVFDKLDHYNKWQFIYDPGTDRGGLLSTPSQPPLQNASQSGQPGASSGTPGTSSGSQPQTQPQPKQPESQPPGGDEPN